MLLLNFGQSDQHLIVTLNEKRTLAAGYYLFYFMHILTKAVVTKIYAFSDDNSDYPDRYNDFDIDTDMVFTDQPTGQWVYHVFEQASAVNTDPTGLTVVERGIMLLKPVVEFTREMYDPPTTYKAYGG